MGSLRSAACAGPAERDACDGDHGEAEREHGRDAHGRDHSVAAACRAALARPAAHNFRPPQSLTRHAPLALLAIVSAVAAPPSAASAAAPWSAPQPVPGSQQANPFTVGISLGRGERGVIGFSVNPTPQLSPARRPARSPATRSAARSPRSRWRRTTSPHPPVAYGNTRSIVVQRAHARPRAHGIARSRSASRRCPRRSARGRILDAAVKLRDVARRRQRRRRRRRSPGPRTRATRGRRANNDRLYLVAAQGRRPVRQAVGARRQRQAGRRQRRVRHRRPPRRRVRAPGDRPRGGPARGACRRAIAASAARLRADRRPRRRARRHEHRDGRSTADGRAYVAWGTQDGGIEANDPYEVYAATKAAGRQPLPRRRAALPRQRPLRRPAARPSEHGDRPRRRGGGARVHGHRRRRPRGRHAAARARLDDRPRAALRAARARPRRQRRRRRRSSRSPGGDGDRRVDCPASPASPRRRRACSPRRARPAARSRRPPRSCRSRRPSRPRSRRSRSRCAGGAPVVAWYDQQATGILTSRRG